MLLRRQIQSWAVVMFALAYIPPNSHAWYMIWALPLMTLICVDLIKLDRGRQPLTAHANGHSNGHANGHVAESALTIRSVPWPLIVYFAWSFFSFFVYHTWSRG